MILTYQEYREYIDANLRLLYYCYCKKNKVDKELSIEQFIKKPSEAKIEARNYFLENSYLLNEYFESNEQISTTDKEILLGFNNKISGKFIILRQLRSHAIFIDIQSEKFYAVLALWDPFPKVLDSIPVLIEATLIPYNDKIIYDGFLLNRMYIGKNMENNMLDQYKKAKAANMIIKTIG